MVEENPYTDPELMKEYIVKRKGGVKKDVFNDK